MKNLLLSLFLAALPASSLAAQRSSTPTDPTKIPLSGTATGKPVTAPIFWNDPVSGNPSIDYSTRGFAVKGHFPDGQVAKFIAQSTNNGAILVVYATGTLTGVEGIGVSTGSPTGNFDNSKLVVSMGFNSSSGEVDFSGPAQGYGRCELDSDGSAQIRSVLNAASVKADASGNVTIAGNVNPAGTLAAGLATVTNTCAAATTCQATCTGTKKVLGGGCQTTGGITDQDSFPASTTVWQCDTTAATSITAYALCARIGP